MNDPCASIAALQPEPSGFWLGRFLLRRRERQLLAEGAPIELGSRAFDVLVALVEADGRLLTKNELLDRVWPSVAVEENNLQVQVSALRRVLGPDRDWIATIPGRGYRFTGPVLSLFDEEGPPKMRPGLEVAPPRLSVMVLPFAHRGSHPAGDWFADAVTESLTTDFARALPPGSTVIAQATAEIYKNRPVDVRAIGREMGIRYLVEGSIMLSEERVRVNAQLVAAETGASLWADRFDMPRGEVLQDQDQIVGRLSRSLGLQMIDAEARRAERAEQEAPGRADAQDYVVRARAAATQRMLTRVKIETACALFARALERDPDNAEALTGIATQRIYQVLNGYFEPGPVKHDETAARTAHLLEAEQMLDRALAIAPGRFDALKARALMLRARGAFPDALAAAEAVLSHSPGEPTAHREVGLNLLYLGRTEEAVTWFRRADALAPDDPVRWSWLQGLGRALIQLGRDAEAADALRLVIASNATFAAYHHALLAAALALAGEDAAARASMAEFRRSEPDTTVDDFGKRSAVPFEATDTLYKARNGRILEGLRRAADLVP